MTTFHPFIRANKELVTVPRINNTGNLAAIDFGTSSCSVAYSLRNDPAKVLNIPLGVDTRDRRVLTAILLQKDKKYVQIKSFGESALDDYAQMDQSELDLGQCIYFECFKMKLRNNVTLETLVSDYEGKQYYLVEIIAFVLKHLKNEFHEHLKDHISITQLCCTDFEWAITVPAIWSSASKQMMTIAAQKAGLCSKYVEGISYLSPPGQLATTNFDTSKPLKIVLEPECAAIFCEKLAANEKMTHSDPVEGSSKRYMVLDIGGGTVDIAVHQVDSDGDIQSVTSPKGNEFGGTKVNEKLAHLLSHIVRDEGFKSFKRKGENANGTLSKMIYSMIEKEKMRFGKKMEYKKIPAVKEKLIISPDPHFLDFYTPDKINSGVRALGETEITSIKCGNIAIAYSYVMKLIEDILDGIWGCTKDAIEKAQQQIDVIYMVGGFGGCRLIKEMLEMRIGTSFPDMNPKFVVPEKYEIAVSQGAVHYSHNPSKIRSRISDAHFGVSTSIPFEYQNHDEYYAEFDDENKKYCGSVFAVFVEKGQRIYDNEVFTDIYIPFNSAQENITINFYSTKYNVQYISDKTGKLLAKKLGKITITDMPKSSKALPNNKREVKVEMVFSDTEIKAKGTFLPTGAQVTVTLNFL